MCRRKDVGRNKVDAAHDTLEASHNLCTTIDVLHMDVVLHWQNIVELARECTVGMLGTMYMVVSHHQTSNSYCTNMFAVFNNIDVGEYFDIAVLSLCRELHLPYAAGSSYASTCIVEFYTGKPTDSRFGV